MISRVRLGISSNVEYFGGTINDPDTSFFSRIGNFSNMTSASPPQADDAITQKLADGEAQTIIHYVASSDLIALTDGGEWVIKAAEGAVFSPDAIQSLPQSRVGASHVTPVILGSSVIYVRPDRKGLSSLDYEFSKDGYQADDLTLLAHHLFENSRIVDAAAAKTPFQTFFAVREDGKMGVMTYNRLQQVVAWALWETPLGDGFKNVAAIQPSEESDNADVSPYFIVQRNINGKKVQYIERQDTNHVLYPGGG